MMNLTDLFAGFTTARIAAWWAEYGAVVTVAGLVAVLALVALTGLVARRRGRGLAWLANATSAVVLLVTSEGMLMVAVNRLDLPLWFAVLVFGVGELLLIYNALQARAFLLQAAQARADALEADALNGPGAGDPAREREQDLRERAARRRLLVWVVAIVSGVIAALNVNTFGEQALRLALPLAAASQWLDSITPTSSGKRRGVSLWAPLRKVLIRVGLISPAEQDVATINREYQLRAMVNLAVTLQLAPDARLTGRRERRLIRMAQTADYDMIDEAAERVGNALGILRRLTPEPADGDAPETGPVEPVPGSSDDDGSTPAVPPESSTVPPADGSTALELTVTPVPPWTPTPPTAPVPAEPQADARRDGSGGGTSDRAEEIAQKLRADLAAGEVARPLVIAHVKDRYVTSYRNAKAAIEKVNGS